MTNFECEMMCYIVDGVVNLLKAHKVVTLGKICSVLHEEKEMPESVAVKCEVMKGGEKK